jgi:hypothetical protein
MPCKCQSIHGLQKTSGKRIHEVSCASGTAANVWQRQANNARNGIHEQNGGMAQEHRMRREA